MILELLYGASEKLDEINIGEKTIDVLLNTAFMKEHNSGFAMVFKDCYGKLTIFVDNAYMSMPDYMKKFFMNHEIGHIVNGDMNMSLDKLNAMNEERWGGVIHGIELEADKYSASKLSDTELAQVAGFVSTIPFTVGFDIVRKVITRKSTLSQAKVDLHSVKEIGIRAKLLRGYYKQRKMLTK